MAQGSRRMRSRAGRIAVLALGMLLLGFPVGAPAAQKDEPPGAAEDMPDAATLQQMNESAGQLFRAGRYREAEPLLARLLALAERALGPDNIMTLNFVQGLAKTYAGEGRYADAQPLFSRLAETLQRTLGPEHPTTLGALNDLASNAAAQSRYAEAEALQTRTLEASERVLGPEDPRTLVVMANLGNTEGLLGHFAQAETLLSRALAARTRTAGADHPDTLTAASGLAGLYIRAGRFADAEPLATRVFQGRERLLGRDHPDTLTSLGDLALVYADQGRYAEAEPLALRALDASERVRGREHAETLTALSNLAELYRNEHRYADAEPLLQRALEVRQRLLGPDHEGTIVSLNNLALLYATEGRYPDAEPLYTRALATSERVFGREHPATLNLVNGLASLYQQMGRYPDAEPLFTRALSMRERVLGREHPNTLASVNNLGMLYQLEQRPALAEPLLARVAAASERVLGRDHPATLVGESNLATVLLSTPARAAAALDPARKLLAGARTRRDRSMNDGYAQGERRRERIDLTFGAALFADAAWANVAAGRGDREALKAEAFAALQDEMMGDASTLIARMAVRRSADRAGAGLGELAREREQLEAQWQANMDRLSASFASGDQAALAGREPLTAERARIEARLDAIDTRLRAQFPDYFSLIRPEPASVGEARALMGPDEAILMVVPGDLGTHVVVVTRDRIDWTRSAWTSSQVDDAVQRLRWEAGANAAVPQARISQWQAESPADAAPAFSRRIAFDLYQALIAPAAPLLAGKRRLYIAAAGPLAGLPFSVLVTQAPQGADNDPAALRGTAWLADAYSLVHIPSIRSLALLRRAAAAGPPDPRGSFAGFGDPVLLGTAPTRGIDRGRAGTAAALATRSGAGAANLGRLRYLARLPGTVRELEAMRQAIGAPDSALFLAGRATEAAVRAADLSQVRVLAFATHGLVAGDIPGLAEPGLVLTPPAQLSEADDGYLAASEIATLRLNADWVILSACNTAAVRGSLMQDVSGLARAFFYAGARNLLASHWPVDDQVASLITVRTVALEQGGTPRAEAFQQAMREIRQDAGHDSPQSSWAHPFYWAPFVLIGG